MLKKKDICFIILLLIIIIIFIILNKKNEKILKENFYSSQPGLSPEPSSGPSDTENKESSEEENKIPAPTPVDSQEELIGNLVDKLEKISHNSSNETEKIFKEKLVKELFVSSMVNTIKSVLGNMISNKNLNEIINFDIKESTFIIKISNINGTEILNNTELSKNIKDKMIELYAKHIPEINKYEVVLTAGSLIITLKRKEEIANPTCEPTELQELESFMKMFNNSGENIIQYEPDGVSGIFAPYIKLG